MALRLLVVEGNVEADRALYRQGFGRTASEAYARTLREIADDASPVICFAADADAALPAGAALEDFDGAFITGSSLNVYDGGRPIERQIALARAILAAKVPLFGSCWGLQVVSAAMGGSVVKNPRGREIGIARDIRPTQAGRAHPLLAGRGASFAALCSHIDHVETVPPGAVVLASNAMSEVQAMTLDVDGAVFWGVQYHPEYSFAEVAAIIRRRAPALAREGMFGSENEARGYAEALRSLDDDTSCAQPLGVGADLLDAESRRRELVNFLDMVAPRRSAVPNAV